MNTHMLKVYSGIGVLRKVVELKMMLWAGARGLEVSRYKEYSNSLAIIRKTDNV